MRTILLTPVRIVVCIIAIIAVVLFMAVGIVMSLITSRDMLNDMVDIPIDYAVKIWNWTCRDR